MPTDIARLLGERTGAALIAVDKSELDLQPIDWRGLHRNYLNVGEMEVIAALVRSVGARLMIEFGCRDGRTAAVLLRNVPSIEHYVGVDVPMSYRPGLVHQRSEMVAHPGWYAMGSPRFELLIRDAGTFDLAPSDLPECDAVFVDGDHSEAAVAHDSNLACDIVRPGGIVIWHDYHQNDNVEVRRVLDRLSDQGWPICVVKDTWLAFRRI